MVRLALSVPTAAGLNATKMMQFAPGARVVPQVLTCVNEVALVPEIAIPAISSVVLPALVTVTLFASEVVPTAVDANVRLVPLNVTESSAVAVPLSAAVCGEFVALPATLSDAVFTPAEAGLNDTKTVQLVPEASDAPQLFNCWNCVAPVPVIEIEVRVTLLIPVFATLTCSGELTEPAAISLNASVAGVSEMSLVGGVIVYNADPTALAKYPGATAIAFKVSVADTVTGVVYFVDAVVGAAPLVV